MKNHKKSPLFERKSDNNGETKKERRKETGF